MSAPLRLCLAAGLAIAFAASPCKGNSFAYTPGGFMETDDAASVVRIGYSIALLQEKFRSDLEKSRDSSIKLHTKRFSLSMTGEHATVLTIDAKYEIDFRHAGAFRAASCDGIHIETMIPAINIAERPELFQVLKLHHATDCKSSTAIPLPGAAFAALEKDLTRQINASFADLSKDFQGQLFKALGLDASGQPEQGDNGGAFVREALAGTWVQGAGCRRMNADYLCLTLAMPKGNTVRMRDAVVRAAPAPVGRHTMGAQISARIREIEAEVGLLPRKDSTRFKPEGYRYPASQTDPSTYDDGDVTLYAGLICSGGDEEGCEAVRRAQGASGQIWRAPDLVDAANSPSKSDFSGDQFKGVALLGAFGKPTDKAILQRWVDYISKQRGSVPSGGGPGAVEAYRSCTREVDNTCVLSAEDWSMLRLLARRQGLNGLPALQGDTTPDQGAYGWTPEALEYSALFSKLGFRAHLVGVQVMTMRHLGVSDPALHRSAAILAARDDGNPFYRYLLHGKDDAVSTLALRSCDMATLRSVKSKHSWVWQHASRSEKWKIDPVIWDCYTLLRLLQ